MLLELIATICAGVFAGAAIYVNLVEHPARVETGTAAAVLQWRPSYRRGTTMQAGLAIAGLLAAIGAWLQGRGVVVLIGGLVLGFVVPFTLFVIFPTNRQLSDTTLDVDSARAAVLLARWNSLHIVRSAAGFCAFMILVIQWQPSASRLAQRDERCTTPSLAGESRDAATVLRLEREWSVAYLRGDTAFERCLLTPDFTEVMRSGAVKGLSDELGFAVKNIGQNVPIPDLPTPIVVIHGDAAVAYAKVQGAAGVTVYADFYDWVDGRWRVYFAQQTPA